MTFTLQALQISGAWYSLGSFNTRQCAERNMKARGGWRSGRVKYRIVRA